MFVKRSYEHYRSMFIHNTIVLLKRKEVRVLVLVLSFIEQVSTGDKSQAGCRR